MNARFMEQNNSFYFFLSYKGLYRYIVNVNVLLNITDNSYKIFGRFYQIHNVNGMNTGHFASI